MFELVLAFSFSLVVVGVGLHSLFTFAFAASRVGTVGYRESDDGVLSRRSRTGGVIVDKEETGELGHYLGLLVEQEMCVSFLRGQVLDLSQKEGEALQSIMRPFIDAADDTTIALQEVPGSLMSLENGEMDEEGFQKVIKFVEVTKQRRTVMGSWVAPRVASYLQSYFRSQRSS